MKYIGIVFIVLMMSFGSVFANEKVDTTGILFIGGTPMSESPESSGDSLNQGGDPLSQNDRNFYETIKKRLGSTYQARVIKVADKFEDITDGLLPAKREALEKEFVAVINRAISKLLRNAPQDTALPEDTNNLYLMLSMLKFEVQLVGYNADIGGRYTCNTNKYFTIYTRDYVIDDMAFSVDSDEIHARDGATLLANYTGTQTSSNASKYAMKNTETNKHYTFQFEGGVLKVSDSETILHVCRKK